MAVNSKKDQKAYDDLAKSNNFVKFVENLLTFIKKHKQLLFILLFLFVLLVLATLATGLYANRHICNVVFEKYPSTIKTKTICKIYYWLKEMWSLLFCHIATFIGGVGGGGLLVAKFTDNQNP